MSIFFNTNIPEMRSIFLFNRMSNEIAESVRRLATGQRILTGKDDPAGLISRETMRLDIRGIQAAQKNTMAANDFLATADSGLANISRILVGDINNKDDNGLIGLIYDTTLPTDMRRQQINNILNMIDSTVRATNYNGKRMLDGSLNYRISGIDSGKLSNVSVSDITFGSSQAQPVNMTVIEQAKQGALQIDGIVLSNPFDLRLVGKNGEEIEINGSSGSYTEDDIVNAVNAKTSETGVQARLNGTSIVFETLEVGSKQSLSLIDLNGNLTITDMSGHAATSNAGRDVLVRINGQQVQGNGRDIQFSSSDLTMSATISQAMKAGEKTQFNVAGGALFQLGKDVQPSMQYRMALPGMTTFHLGGASGTLEDLRDIDLETDAGKARAYSIVNEAINMVAVQRGTIGAVQKHVLDSNSRSLDTQLESVMEAEGLISNVDMAWESSRLNRAEILAQSAMKTILYSQNIGRWLVNLLS
jgi:flagellin